MENESYKAEPIKEDPKFTQYDFMSTEKPFEYVAEVKDNDFLFMQRQEIVNKNAKEVHITSFKKMMKSYMQQKYPKNKSVYVNETEFENQPMTLNCGEYYCNDSGITTYTESGYPIDVCNHPIMPIERLVNIDDNTEKLKLAYKKGFMWREIIVDKETLASNNKILALAKYGVAVNSENAKYLVRYFTDIECLNFDTIPEFKSVGRLGWINNRGFSPYVDDLVFDGNETFRAFFQSVHPQGSSDKWFELVKDIRQSEKSKTARILLAASFASVLVEICDCLPFFVHIWGGTGAGKTVGLMLAASAWANPSVGDYIHTFNSTNVAQELSATFVNSLPLIMDELQIIKKSKDFDNIIYSLSEGVGCARGQKTGGIQKIGTWKNCIITSGEFPISNSASGAGAVNRIIEINCEDEKIFEDAIHVVDVIKRNYGSAGRLFIEYLQFDGKKEEIRKQQKEIFKQLINDSEITEKQAISASLLLLADELTAEVIFEDDIKLTVDDIRPYLSTKSEVDQNERCLEFIYDFVAINYNKFSLSTENQNEIWGCMEHGYIYINKAIFDKALTDNGYNPTAFLSWAKLRGLIQGDKNHNTKVKRYSGTRCRCVALIDNELADFENSDENDGDLPF